MLCKLAFLLFLFSGRLAQSTDDNDKNMHNLLVCIRQMEPNSKDTILKLPNSCEDLMSKVVDHWKLREFAKQDQKVFYKRGAKVSSKMRTWQPWT